MSFAITAEVSIKAWVAVSAADNAACSRANSR